MLFQLAGQFVRAVHPYSELEGDIYLDSAALSSEFCQLDYQAGLIDSLQDPH